jgi:protein gp37
MTRTTGIEWTEHTVNFWVGCEIVSAGCTNCYAMRMARRLEVGFGQPAYAGTTKSTKAGPVWTGKVNRATDRMFSKPLHIRQPSLIFVNSMSDFWNEAAVDEWRADAFEIMRRAGWHKYQLLTKRPENILPIMRRMGLERLPDNVWCGVTVEDHRVAHRIDLLRQVPAAVRFISVEPMTAPLGEVDLTGVHWVIGGGESGPKARPMQAEWARELRDLCTAQNVAFFWKQYGRPQNNPLWHETPDGWLPADFVRLVDSEGKGGSLIDGRHWKEYPTTGDDR